MATPRKELDTLMEMWARWVHLGGVLPSSASLMEVMIANKGVMCFGSGGKKSPVVDSVEARIESALMALAEKKPVVAKVVRIHYGAIRLKGVAPEADQATIAHAMGVSLRTYRRYLAQGRDHINHSLGR
ncbi:TPA: hypothetical protein NKZ51_004500 [Vibrio parahaemolyticus]|uniref:Phage antitermination protein Q n=1 Tax=Vibrio alginolyticus TaxID=663 RepID=A0A7Y0QZN3_VIBAL|nr:MULTISPECIES: hypothetical protein [Vibrio]MDW2204303.1 hypothetical protein [Vibrio sp. 1636]MDW2216228.1 hypothetical protein [Vibrio sp. 1982]NMR76238.1 hypothetical protein [Vibrio alginolyticus]HCH5589148.1 hypothetical protein [Vibrio parahaemolyticus]